MEKLLSANFSRLNKNKLFWFCLAAIFIGSAGIVLNGCRQAALETVAQNRHGLEHYYFNMCPMLGLFWACFSSLFLGTEYSDGTIRNKLIVGHSRTAVYFSNWIAVTAATFLMTAAWMLGGLAGIPMLGPWQMRCGQLLQMLGIYFLSAAAMSAVLTMLQMLIPNRAIGAVVSITVFLGLLVLASMLYNALAEPEMASNMIYTLENGIQVTDPMPNPYYIAGLRRTIYQFLVRFLPTGQEILIANQELSNPGFMALSSLAITAITTLGGMAVFQRKNIK